MRRESQIEPRMEIVPRRSSDIVVHESFFDAPDHVRFHAASGGWPEWTCFANRQHICDGAFDADGNVWLATWGGVVQWQREARRCVHHTSEHGLLGNATRNLVVDGQGCVWASSRQRGLTVFKPDVQAWQLQLDQSDWEIVCMAARPQGGIYVGLCDGKGRYGLGEIVLPRGRMRQVEIENFLAYRALETIWADPQRPQTIWLGNAWGLHRYDRESRQTTSFVEDGQELRLWVRKIAPAATGKLWVGTNRGVYLFDAEATSPFHRERDWPRESVLQMAPGAEGNVWLSTAREVGQIIDGAWEAMADEKRPAGRINMLLAETAEKGTVWAGCGHGLYELGGKKRRSVLGQGAEDVLSNGVQCLLAVDRSLYVGAVQGVYRYEGVAQQWSNYSRYEKLQDVRALVVGGANGRLWIGSWRHGLQRMEQGVYLPDGNPVRSPVMAAAADGQGDVWMATVNGLYRQQGENGRWEAIPSPPATIGIGLLQALCVQREQQVTAVWVGTSDGLFQYRTDTELWQPVADEVDLGSIKALDIDSRGWLWVGGSAGLHCLTDDGWQQVLAGRVQVLLFTDDSVLWVGTDAGLEKWQVGVGKRPLAQQPEAVFTVTNSGLAANQVTALAWQRNGDKQALWIGSGAGISRYLY
ncbi:MAG: hypothetical protein KDE56_03440 [Anaerolineales bacterium]|nr:hypothetical protein [Anaerolineales bacterium]